jgi:BirA family biotin operon repressor/biotin-[acetyl-CoA-carboxylase] ligase
MMKNNDKIKWFAALGSTNDYIMDHRRELTDRTIVAAKAQTDGKGLGDNRWYSEPDQSLTFSYLLSPAHVMARQQFLISMAAAIALRDVISAKTGRDVQIKWPNDILVEDKKIAGVLIQHYIMGEEILSSVIGAGINLNQTSFPESLPNPTSLKLVGGAHYHPGSMLEEIQGKLDSFLQWQVLSSPGPLVVQYLKSLYRYKEWKRYIIRGKEVVAQIKGITGLGMLELVDEASKTYQCDIKEVVYLY